VHKPRLSTIAAAAAQVRPLALRTFTPSLHKAQLPRHLDWRATPADFAVKDQVC
jgi:hypothetical protein